MSGKSWNSVYMGEEKTAQYGIPGRELLSLWQDTFKKEQKLTNIK